MKHTYSSRKKECSSKRNAPEKRQVLDTNVLCARGFFVPFFTNSFIFHQLSADTAHRVLLSAEGNLINAKVCAGISLRWEKLNEKLRCVEKLESRVSRNFEAFFATFATFPRL
jgi:hypothetical protein